jgi:para-nitrobenzyl esterase
MSRLRFPSRRAVLWAAVTALIPATVAVTGPAEARHRSGAVVTTDKGAVRGTVTGAGRVFRAIPYAAPPVAALRWRAPRPAAAWTGVRDATRSAPDCAQEADPFTGGARVTSEDCLYLNVWTPAKATRPLPVLVYLHGGAFVNGSGDDFDGAALAAKGTVVVTVNYRLGAFGFLAEAGLSSEDAAVGSGNYGLLDQQAALRWVRANAAAFGGNPTLVTTFGQSAGAESVCANLTSPAAAGLFQRAIMQSGPCHQVTTPLTRAEQLGAALAAHTRCAGQAALPACLRAVPAADILDACGATPELATVSQVWAPTTGTPVLPEAPSAAIAGGRFHRMPLIVGTTLDEGTVLALGVSFSLPLTRDTYPVLMGGWFGENVPLVEARYPVANYGGDYAATISAVMGDWLVSCPDARLRRSLAAGTRTFAYEFADREAPNILAITPSWPLGAYHGSDVVYLTRPAGVTLGPGQLRLSDALLTYWAAFAAAGDPNAARTPAWHRFTATRPESQTLDVGAIGPSTDFEARHRCGFWAELENS